MIHYAAMKFTVNCVVTTSLLISVLECTECFYNVGEAEI